MTVHEFVMMLMEAVESVDMGDTAFRVRGPDGTLYPVEFDWEDDGYDTDEGLVLVVDNG